MTSARSMHIVRNHMNNIGNVLIVVKYYNALTILLYFEGSTSSYLSIRVKEVRQRYRLQIDLAICI